MKEPVDPCCRKGPITFIADALSHLIYTDNRHTDRVSTTASELSDLVAQVINYPVYLLDHRLCENLYLNSDFDGGYGAPRYQIPRVDKRRFTRNDFTKSSVSASGFDSPSAVLTIQNAASMLYCCD